MSMNRRMGLPGLLAVAVLLGACRKEEGQKDYGEAVKEQAQQQESAGDAWLEAKRKVQEGQQQVREAQKQLEAGRAKIQLGEDEMREAEQAAQSVQQPTPPSRQGPAPSQSQPSQDAPSAAAPR